MSARAGTTLLSPTKDILLFFPALTALAALLIWSMWTPDILGKRFPYFLFTSINSLHTGMPIAYALFFTGSLSAARRPGMWRGFVLLFLASVGIVILAQHHLMLVAIGLPTIFILISTYHFYRQDLGVCSMYRSLDSRRTAAQVNYERYLVGLLALAGPILYWLGTGTRFYSLRDYLGGPLPLSGVLVALRYLGIFSFAAYMAYHLLYRRHFNLRLIYVSGLFISFMAMLQPNLLFLPFVLQFVFRIHTHNWIEIAFQGKLLRSEARQGGREVFLKVAGYLLLVAGITYFFSFSKAAYGFMDRAQNDGDINPEALKYHMESIGFQIWATGWIFASFLHYYIGRYVYDFSEPSIRKKLSFGEAA